jgi:Protein of unknown function (DUF2874).
MKTTKILLSMAITSSILIGCSKSENNSPVNINQEVKEALSEKYPEAKDVKWTNKGNYIIAEFNSPIITKVATYKHSAWFDNTGKWHMTETDITFDQLPEAVKTSFKSSEYATWRIDDVDKIERNSVEIVYVIEIEQVVNKIETEIDLYYSEDGILVKKVTDVDNDNDDDDYEDYIPSTPSNNISDYINKIYPNARIIDIDHEDGVTEVEIIDGKIKRELIFNSANQWIRTITEIRRSELPKNILDAILSSEYKTYEIDDIEFIQEPNSEFYLVELEKGELEVKIKISKEGVIIK